MGTILGALGFVLLLLLGCAKLFLKQSPLAMPGLPRDAIEVLGRRTVDPRNTIYVVKVGGKVLLLGGSVNGLAPLSEITDPIEVATLINTCRAVDAPRRSLADWWREKWQRRPQPDPRPFSERFGEQLFQQAEQGGQRLTSLTVRGPQEGSRHA